MEPVVLYVADQYVASVRRVRHGRLRYYKGRLSFIGHYLFPDTFVHVCLKRWDSPIEALGDAVSDAEALLRMARPARRD